MEVTGTIKLIGETQSFGGNGFTKRQFVVETDEQYPSPIPMDFIKEKCSILDSYKVGDKVKVSINLKGQEHNGRYFLNANAWRIEREQGTPVNNTPYENAANDQDPPF